MKLFQYLIEIGQKSPEFEESERIRQHEMDGCLADVWIIQDQKKDFSPYHQKREEPIILITGYWPPTNEMIRDFSQNLDLNQTIVGGINPQPM